MTDALQPQDIFAPSNLTPLSNEEIAALQYAAFMQHLQEIAGVFELERAERARKEADARRAQEALEGKALTAVLNRLGFPIADLPSNEYRAPDGVRYCLFVGELFTQAIESQEPDRFYLRISFSNEYEICSDEDQIYASRSFGDHRRMMAEHITNIQSLIPAAIQDIKAEVETRSKDRARRIAAAAADKPKLSLVPQFRTEVMTLDHSWDHDSEDHLETSNDDLAHRIGQGWAILNCSVQVVELQSDYDSSATIYRTITLVRHVPAEAVQS